MMMPQVIQRVEVREKTSTICFDDTPGGDDTTYTDRMPTLSLMAEYKKKHFQDTLDSSKIIHTIYPNVILIIVDWMSLTPDAHNSPTFTSSLGKSMYNLLCSKLVDLNRPNVIVVVTKSLSYWSQFDDYPKKKDKNEHWKIDAAEREGIIKDLHRTIFPRSKSFDWPIIFVENGGGSDVADQYIELPDGQLSHQNLFTAMCELIENTADGNSGDMLGLSILKLFAKKHTYHLERHGPIDLVTSSSTALVPVSFFDRSTLIR
jgi:hypothetical protein